MRIEKVDVINVHIIISIYILDRDYCSPVYGTTRYLETCTDGCERRDGKPFFWCHTYPSVR